MKTEKVLILGSAGLVGSNLLKNIKKDILERKYLRPGDMI